MARIGLLFGSFNPVHNGHLSIAKAGLKQAKCQKVWFVIQAHNPHKQQKQLAPLEDRVLMVRLATANKSQYKLVATRTTGIIAVHNQLKQHSPRDKFVLLMGQDLVDNLPQWPDHQEITKRFQIFGYQRQSEAGDISSERIREDIGAGRPIGALVPPAVEKYITQHNLYL